jgi:hypothetical protein
MLNGAREVRLGWPVSNAALNLLRDAAVAANLTEPTEAMVLGSFLQRQALTVSSAEVAITGRIRKILGNVEESLESSACCKKQCSLGRSAHPLGRAICAQSRADEPVPPRPPQPA